MSRRSLLVRRALLVAVAAALALPAAADRPAARPSSRSQPAAKGTISTKAKAKAVKPRPEAPHLPFVEGDYAVALADARARNVPLVVDVWAPW